MLTADELTGEVLDSNNVFIPIAVGPSGELGTLVRRFIENCKVLPLPTFSQDRPNEWRAAERAVTHRRPYDVFTKADRAWRKAHGHTLFDGSYLSKSPSVWANQRIRLATVTHLANHINTSFTKIQLSSEGEAAIICLSRVMISYIICPTGTSMTARWGILPTDTGKTIWDPLPLT
jgi:hypothetical protein